tara:strand:- start:902 stop:1129 length:228 start_codon:yes stop_codon:yes gene_type:complete
MTEHEWRSAIDNRLASIEARMNVIERQDAVAEVHHMNVEKRLGSIEGTLVWLVRSIIGALLIAFVAFVVSGGIST